MKSYNTRSLRGEDYDDLEFQRDMSNTGVVIPDSLLFKPEMNDYVIDQVRKQNIVAMVNDINPETGEKYTSEVAAKKASELADVARRNVTRLMKQQ